MFARAEVVQLIVLSESSGRNLRTYPFLMQGPQHFLCSFSAWSSTVAEVAAGVKSYRGAPEDPVTRQATANASVLMHCPTRMPLALVDPLAHPLLDPPVEPLVGE